MNTSPARVWREKGKRYQYLGKRGVILSVTRIVEGMGELPYWVGMMGMADGEKVMGKLVVKGQEKPQVGERVIGVLRKLDEGGKQGVIEYGVKFQITNNTKRRLGHAK